MRKIKEAKNTWGANLMTLHDSPMPELGWCLPLVSDYFLLCSITMKYSDHNHIIFPFRLTALKTWDVGWV